ncbi:MAG: hypothetical protein GW861_03935 [Deltaproteobacteria bacterium]|nr:hypothetical protein [Deltaproteobacteria bacterium]
MVDSLSDEGFVHFKRIFPRARKGVTAIEVPIQFHKVTPDNYLFGELYCIKAGCDCRMVKLQVVTSKLKPIAVIDFPLDIDSVELMPALSPGKKHGAAAPGLLEIFMDSLVDNPEWYRAMCKSYRAVRKKVEQKTYQGKRFPSSRCLEWLGEPEDDEDDEEFFTELKDLFSGMMTSVSSKTKPMPTVKALQDNLFSTPKNKIQLTDIIDAYSEQASDGPALEGKLDGPLRNLMRQNNAPEDLVCALVTSFQAGDDLKLEAISRILFDWLEILRTDIERRRPDADAIMDRLQTALARQVFHPEVDPGLGSEVTRILLSTRVEILPQLHEANSKRMSAMKAPEEVLGAEPKLALEQMLADFNNMGLTSSFELVDTLLPIMAVGDWTVQLEFYRHLLFSAHEIAREAVALMVFHPQREVREGVADLLAGIEGSRFSPVMLRRLIIARNWFPENMRNKLDQAINNARRARIECAPLAVPAKIQIYASVMDGANAQSFMALLPRGKGYLGFSIMLKTQHGVADAFILSLEDKEQLKELKRVMLADTGSIETARTYFDQRICQGLADGAAVDKVPPHWLVAIAEQLGNDRWKAIAFDCNEERQQLQQELTQKKRATALKANKEKALQASARWLPQHAFTGSWFEDDVEVDKLLDHFFTKSAGKQGADPVAQVVEKILETRRQRWLNRLVIATIWLKHAVKPPIPWEQMYHLAEAVADSSTPLQNIPLMRSIANSSIGAYWGRQKNRS